MLVHGGPTVPSNAALLATADSGSCASQRPLRADNRLPVHRRRPSFLGPLGVVFGRHRSSCK